MTFAISVTLVLYGKPLVSLRPDPVWKEGMWDTQTLALLHTHTHTFPAIIWLEIFLVMWMRSNTGSL